MQKRVNTNGDPEVATKRQRREDDNNSETEDSIVESSIIEASQLSEKMGPMAGIVRRVTLHNFMCHSHLDVPLGSHVNFIVGRNGSGKSAVITGLVVGLGGKAGITGRGRSIKNFIKNGKREARVEICLNNKGKDSYKHHIYGDKIVVKRKFSIDGGSSYSIHSESGQHISARRDELMHITNHFNIQVDNPVCILNQDTSRNFLNSKSSGDKFKFFMRATQLEQVSSDYDEVRRHMESTRQEIDSKHQTLVHMHKDVKHWEGRYKSLAALSELKQKVLKLKNELAWALVAAKERGMRPLEKSLKSEENALPRFMQKVDQAKQEQESCEARHKGLEQQVIDCSKVVRDLEPLLQARHKDVQAAKKKLAPIQDKLKGIDRELRGARAECSQCEQRIEELKTLASRDYDAEKRNREEQIGELQKSMEELSSKQRVTEHEIEQYLSNVTRGQKEVAELKTQSNAKNHKLREVRTNLHTLQAAKNDRLQRFGTWMPEVMKAINQNKRRFHKLPVGPLGACFDLKESKWALAMESCLKGLVRSFVCHDHNDEKVLEEIFGRLCPRGQRPPIITCHFSDKIHNVSRFKVKTKEFPCVLDMVKCSNPVVVNTLIDQRSIENVLLIEDSDTARQVMMRRPPENCRECFTLGGDQAFCQPTFRYYSSDKTTVRFLMADVQEQITLLQEQEKLIHGEMNALNQESKDKQSEMNKNQQLERGCRTKLNQIKEKISRDKFDIQELQSVEDPAPIDVTTLEEEVREYKSQIEVLKEQRHAVLKEKSDSEAKLQETKQSLEQVEEEIRQKSDDGIPLREAITQAQSELETARNNRKHYAGKLKDQEKKIQEIKKELERYKSDVETDKGKALQICEPIPTQRSPDNVESEIRQIERRVAEEERVQGSELEITETFKERKDTYMRVQKELQQLQNFLEKLDETMEKRQINYMEMRKNIANRTKYYFLRQMYHRGFTGKMMFEFNKGTLDILVNPGKDLSGSKDRKAQGSDDQPLEGCDLKSLSGGERSFSTVCFILALWEAMESPFRCLDEFDVFMDMVNRSISMDMMMKAASAYSDMQFVFLTPQDMSSQRRIKSCKIFRMPDPERTRNQSTIDFSQASTQ